METGLTADLVGPAASSLTTEERANLDAEFEEAIMRGASSIASVYMMDVVSALQDDTNDPMKD